MYEWGISTHFTDSTSGGAKKGYLTYYINMLPKYDFVMLRSSVEHH